MSLLVDIEASCWRGDMVTLILQCHDVQVKDVTWKKNTITFKLTIAYIK